MITTNLNSTMNPITMSGQKPVQAQSRENAGQILFSGRDELLIGTVDRSLDPLWKQLCALNSPLGALEEPYQRAKDKLNRTGRYDGRYEFRTWNYNRWARKYEPALTAFNNAFNQLTALVNSAGKRPLLGLYLSITESEYSHQLKNFDTLYGAMVKRAQTLDFDLMSESQAVFKRDKARREIIAAQSILNDGRIDEIVGMKLSDVLKSEDLEQLQVASALVREMVNVKGWRARWKFSSRLGYKP